MITFLAALVLADTPEKTVQAFVDAFNARDKAALSREIDGGKPASLPFLPGTLTLKATLGEAKFEGDKATVEADVEMSSGPSQVQRAHEAIALRRTDGNWAIVPVDPESGGMRESRFIGVLAYLTTNPGLFTRARTAAKKTACLSNVKQLALGTILYSSDHNDVLPKAASWKSSIMPYVKNERIFHCPEDASGGISYFLDPRVSGLSQVSVANPAGTAMIVEGTSKKTAFRHAGRASLGFVDGHAKIVDAPTMHKARTIPLK